MRQTDNTHVFSRRIFFQQGHIGRIFYGHAPLAFIHIRAIHFLPQRACAIEQSAGFIFFLRRKNSLYIKIIIFSIREILRILQFSRFVKSPHHHIGQFYLYRVFSVRRRPALHIFVSAVGTKTAPPLFAAPGIPIYTYIQQINKAVRFITRKRNASFGIGHYPFTAIRRMIHHRRINAPVAVLVRQPQCMAQFVRQHILISARGPICKSLFRGKIQFIWNGSIILLHYHLRPQSRQ